MSIQISWMRLNLVLDYGRVRQWHFSLGDAQESARLSSTLRAHPRDAFQVNDRWLHGGIASNCEFVIQSISLFDFCQYIVNMVHLFTFWNLILIVIEYCAGIRISQFCHGMMPRVEAAFFAQVCTFFFALSCCSFHCLCICTIFENISGCILVAEVPNGTSRSSELQQHIWGKAMWGFLDCGCRAALVPKC